MSTHDGNFSAAEDHVRYDLFEHADLPEEQTDWREVSEAQKAMFAEREEAKRNDKLWSDPTDPQAA